MDAQMTPRVLLLDALGTLIGLEPPAPALRRVMAERFGIGISESQAAEALAAEIAYYRKHLDEGRDERSLGALRLRCAGVLRDALAGVDGIAQVGARELTEALLASLRFTPFPDARPALETARDRGQRLIVVSNWDVSLVEVLGRLELAPMLDGIITSAQIGARKPSPRIFRHALDLAGVGADECVHIGDTVDDDIEGARAAGIRAILIRRDGAAGPLGVPTIRSLAELET
jgi:putative hydrolase of the HAD superfamily